MHLQWAVRLYWDRPFVYSGAVYLSWVVLYLAAGGPGIYYLHRTVVLIYSALCVTTEDELGQHDLIGSGDGTGNLS